MIGATRPSEEAGAMVKQMGRGGQEYIKRKTTAGGARVAQLK